MTTNIYHKATNRIVNSHSAGWNVTTAINYTRAYCESRGINIEEVYFRASDNSKHTVSRAYHFVNGERKIYKEAN